MWCPNLNYSVSFLKSNTQYLFPGLLFECVACVSGAALYLVLG